MNGIKTDRAKPPGNSGMIVMGDITGTRGHSGGRETTKYSKMGRFAGGDRKFKKVKIQKLKKLARIVCIQSLFGRGIDRIHKIYRILFASLGAERVLFFRLLCEWKPDEDLHRLEADATVIRRLRR